MKKRYTLLFLLSVLIVTLGLSCSSRENEAKMLMLETQAMINAGDWDALKQHLDRIQTEYPETKAAETARVMQKEIISRVNDIAKAVLKQAIVTAIGCQASQPDAAINMKKLHNFGFSNKKDVVVEVEKSQAGSFLLSAYHDAGDTVFFGGGDGRIWGEELEEETE